MRPRWLLALVCAAALWTLLPVRARAIDYNLSGSVQLDYLLVPFRGTDPRPRSHTLDGFTEELSVKLAVDFNSHISANVKVCWGCHGFELPTGFVDFRLADELNFRVGRFNPAFGLALHKSTVTMMLVWYALCWTGMLGPIANWAHTAGLAMGIAWGLLAAQGMRFSRWVFWPRKPLIRSPTVRFSSPQVAFVGANE